MAEPPGFLHRWSRLKQAERARELRRGAPVPGPERPPAPVAEPEDPLQDLPPVETLTKDSDFSAFMRPGVPEELRNAALRKLWESDPVYANLDGLLEYGEDFAEPFRLAGAIATVYRVLEGMPAPQPPASDTADADPPAGAAPEETAPASPVERDSKQG